MTLFWIVLVLATAAGVVASWRDKTAATVIVIAAAMVAIGVGALSTIG